MADYDNSGYAGKATLTALDNATSAAVPEPAQLHKT